ncbi:MAG: HD-GYP domain-containing protein [Pseudobdellovibrionaceae bacterium]
MSWNDIPDWSYDVTKSLLESLHLVDPVTYFHCLRVGESSRKLARSLGLNEYEQRVAEFSGIFHDIGKVGISPTVINKPARLSDEEYDLMKRHPEMSVKLIEPLKGTQFFADMIPAVLHHHERMDGRGYPEGVFGEKIPLVSRIILIADTVDAMSETRPYRKGLPIDIVYAELKRCAGTQFDERLVKVFLEAHPTWEKEGHPETQVRLKRAA